MTKIPYRMRVLVAAIGHRVRARRVSLRMSQVELARKARISRKSVGQVERGEINSTIVTLVMVAEGLGCSLSDLIPGGEANAEYVFLTPKELRRLRGAVTILSTTLAARDGARVS